MARTKLSLARKGRAARLLVSLALDDEDKLARLASTWGCSRAEVIRRLLRAAMP